MYQDASLSDPTSPLYASLVLLRQLRELASHNKALRAAWTNQDVLLKSVVQLFTQCRNRQTSSGESKEETASTQLLHDIILDLLAEVPESMMAEASLPDVSR